MLCKFSYLHNQCDTTPLPQWIWYRVSDDLCQNTHGLDEIRSNLIDFHGAEVGQLC